MSVSKVVYCRTCKKKRVTWEGDQCKACSYKSMMAHQRSLDPEDQDWEFAHCEECGSSLNSEGVCTNTSCGASPYQGTDWY